MPSIDQMPDALADLNASGSPVSSRIGTPDNAVAITNRFLRDNSVRMIRMVKVSGLIGGNAPHSPAAQRSAGRAGDSNLNWREGGGEVKKACAPYYDLTTEVPICVDGDLEYAGDDIDSQLMRGFAENFHDTVFTWDQFDRTEQLRDFEMVLHGIGTQAWEDTLDWRPRTILATDVYVSSEAESDLGNSEIVMITASKTAGYLWSMIKDEKEAAAMGWDVEAVKQAIMLSVRGDSIMLQWKWERWQQAFINGDIYITQTQTKMIRVAILYVKEMDGKISQHIVQYSNKTGTNKYLFSSIGKFSDWKECICPFAYDVGLDGTWHSVKGYGTELYPFCELSNRIKNTLADMVLMGIKPIFQPTTGTTAEKFQLFKMGGYNIAPPNLNILPNNIGTSLAPALEFSRSMEQTLMNNTGTYRENLSGTVERTAKEVTINSMDQAKLTKSAHNRFYRSKDRQYAEMWRRMTNPNLKSYHPGAKEALEFQDRCYKLCDKMGVKHEALQMVRNIRATRAIGLGSPAMRMDIANDLMQPTIYDRLLPVGQNNAMRAWLSTRLSHSNIDSFAPSLSQGERVTDDEWAATIENNELDRGGKVIITPRQDPVVHLNVHVGSMEEDAQAFQQGADAVETFHKLEFKGAHSYLHMESLIDNPMKHQQAKAFGERLRVLANLQDQLQQNIEEAQQANPPQQQPSPEMAKVQGTLQLKSQKQQADLQLKQQKLRDELALKQQQQNADIALKAHSTGADIRLNDLTTAADIRRKAANGNS